MRAQALKRVEADKILDSDDKLKKCESWLITPNISGEVDAEVEEKDKDVLLWSSFLKNLPKDAIELVVKDSGTQVRHDDLPIAYRAI